MWLIVSYLYISTLSLTFLFQGPESKKERRERECLRMEIKSRKKVEERRNSRKEEHREAHMSPLVERESK